MASNSFAGRHTTALIIAGVMLVVVIAAVGVFVIQRDDSSGPEKISAQSTSLDDQIDQAEARDAYAECAAAESKLVDELDELSDLVGEDIAYSDYSDAVNDVRTEYRSDTDQLDLGEDCLSKVVAPAEDALKEYAQAADDWGECEAQGFCDVNSLKLDEYWSKASANAKEAAEGLSEMAPNDAADDVGP